MCDVVEGYLWSFCNLGNPSLKTLINFFMRIYYFLLRICILDMWVRVVSSFMYVSDGGETKKFSSTADQRGNSFLGVPRRTCEQVKEYFITYSWLTCHGGQVDTCFYLPCKVLNLPCNKTNLASVPLKLIEHCVNAFHKFNCTFREKSFEILSDYVGQVSNDCNLPGTQYYLD